MRRPGQLVRVKLIDASTPGAIDPIRSSVDLARKDERTKQKIKRAFFFRHLEWYFFLYVMIVEDLFILATHSFQ